MYRTRFAYVVAFIAALVPLLAAGSAYQEKYLLSYALHDGSLIDGQVYGRISPGNRWVLHVNTAEDAVRATNIDGRSRNLSNQQAGELVEGLLLEIKLKHAAKLDSIRFDASTSTAFQEDIVAKLRQAPVPGSLKVQAKSKEITALLESIIRESDLATAICSKVGIVDARCSAADIGVNPVAFELQYQGHSWGEMKSQPLAGLQLDSLSFFVTLQPD
ncbi:MAG: hypothetical protein RSA54_11920 [Glutamicibacter sp.]|uniref:hypothetical protein n=1 Tax=Stenotrophomonas sp. TaxID=69392 RepID=UPI002FC584B5